ncbi:hypothetical protein C6W92_02820 [Roseovarius sp. A46]|uniref:hypothetical protein n=1 Tax=Roseovarius sp. A46 TaxID=2109331 RepID=UPI0010134B92|nr:hypothetical protein [Roseovarius sp. A46]RXV66750.1 hypothetical protein C6W92_02820 [Roseovarius sp. A46]
MMIRTHDDIDAATLTTAEKTLLENCRAGEPTVLGDGKLPAGPSDARTVRADILRYLICGGCETCPTQDAGVALMGAYVTDTLDLDFATAKGVTGLLACRFETQIEALQARFEILNLSKSHLPGLNAQGARVTGDVFLREVTATEQVTLAGAEIGGQLACDGARFKTAKGKALNAEGARVTGDVFLHGVTATGKVSLSGAGIGGQLACEGARFENAEGTALNAQGARVTGAVFLSGVTATGEVSLSGAEIGGQLACNGARFEAAEGDALNAQKMEAVAVIWREVEAVSGAVGLNGARVGDLADDTASWEKIGHLHLNGFRYERIHGPMDTRMRLKWLAKDAVAAEEFRPQPYEQLAHVMQSMGHTGDARRVRLEKEILLARDWKRRALEEQRDLRERRDAQVTPSDHHEIQNRLARLGLELRIRPLWHGALRTMVGYGHAPQRVLIWLIGTIAVMGSFYLWVWNFGGMVPNSDIILTSPHWAQAMATNPDMPALAWEASEVGQHYQTFAAATYAADVFIPLVDLGQEAAWTATTATAWGSVAWVLSWFLKLFGWIVTAVGAAAITGIIRRE